MDLTNEEAQILLNMPKKIIEQDELKNQVIMRTLGRINNRFIIHSLDCNEVFLMQIKQNRMHLKIDFHFQDNSSHIGLLRVDYNGEHKNPEIANEYVPEIALPYTGNIISESHIHFHVESYKSLAWAVPLNVYDFAIKKMTDGKTFYEATKEFCRKINLQTEIEFEGQVLFL